MNVKKQKELIEYLVSSADTFALCHGVLDHEFFDPSLQPSVKFILDYYEQYSAVPKPNQIESETDLHIKTFDIETHELKYVVNEVETFCKRMKMQEAIMDSAMLIEKDEWGDIEDNIKEALMLSISNDLGVAYYETVEERLERLKDGNQILPTIWDNLNDKLFGGPARKELMLFAAGSGVGKSIVMSNLALGYSDSGLNVLYISFELAQDIVAQRFDTMITGISRRNWVDHIPEIVNGVKSYKQEGTGRLDIKYLPTETKAIEIRSYLKQYQLHFGVTPDVICVDYLDKMTPNKRVQGNSFDIDKKISEQLREIGVDYDCLIVSASQLNRSAVGVDETEQNHSHIAGGISKINESDVFITIYRDTVMEASGEMIFSLQKTRNSDGVGQFCRLEWNPLTLRISDTGLDHRNKDDEIDLSQCGKNSSSKLTQNELQSGTGADLDALFAPNGIKS